MRFEDINAEKARQLGSEERWLAAQDLVHNDQVHFRYRTPDRLEAAVQDKDNWYPTVVSIVDGAYQKVPVPVPNKRTVGAPVL